MKVCLFLVCGVGQIWFTALWSRWLRLRRQSRSSRNRQIAGLTCSWVEVSSSKMLNPKFLLMSSWHLACISVWTGEFDKCCEALWAVCRLENAVEMQVHVPSSSLLHRSVRLHQKRVISYPNDVVSTPAMALRRRPTGRTRMMTMNVLDDQVTDFFWLEKFKFLWVCLAKNTGRIQTKHLTRLHEASTIHQLCYMSCCGHPTSRSDD